MRFPSALALLAASPALAAPTAAEDPAVKADYDAIIVGGGPSGLSAASGLARVRRNVLLIDSGEYRNGPTRHMHDVIGSDGLTGQYFRWAARRLISDYDSATLVNGTVTAIKPQANNSFFHVDAIYPSASGTSASKSVSLTARKIVLATGLRDLIPDTPGLAENWGRGIYWCPWCDGYEHADQPLAILGPLDQGATTVREILSLNRDIVLLVNGTDTPEHRAAADSHFPKWDRYLQLHNITIENRTIHSLERLWDGAAVGADPSLPTHPEHDLFQVNFDQGPPLVRAAFLTNFGEEQRSSIGADTGVKLYGGKMTADPANGLVTNVPGIYAIGDANTDNTTNVPHAMFSGKRAAVYLHVKLESENAAALLASVPNKRHDLTDEAHLRSVWARMNVAGDLLDAGEYR